jgi:hypothetical protein
MTTFLCIGRYPADSPLHQSDQVTVPVAVWEELHAEHTGGERPLFVQLNPADDGPFARVCPAAGSGLMADSCQVPDWMWLRLGAPAPSEGWVLLQPTPLPDAGSIRLRPRHAATLAAMDEPLVQLAEELTGGGAAAYSWACLSVGSELPLPCGEFDVLEITSVEGYPVPGACILDMDVDLELEPALDTPAAQPPPVRIPTPPPSPPHVLTPVATDLISHEAPTAVSGMAAILRQAAQARAARSAAPQGMSFPGIELTGQDTRFPGVGRRLNEK